MGKVVGVVLAVVLGGCDGSRAAVPDAAAVEPDAPWGTATMAPAMWDWGTVSRSNSIAWPTKTFVVTAEGGTPRLQAKLVGPDAGDFHLENDTCSGHELADRRRCTIEVKLDPMGSRFGKRTAILEVSGGTTFQIKSTLAADYQSFGDLTINPGSQSFGMQTVGTTRGTRTFTIGNPSSIATGVFTVIERGSDPTEFTIVTDGCGGQPLGAGAMCSLEIAFAPTTAGQKTALVDIIANPGGAVTAAVSGIATTD